MTFAYPLIYVCEGVGAQCASAPMWRSEGFWTMWALSFLYKDAGDGIHAPGLALSTLSGNHALFFRSFAALRNT